MLILIDYGHGGFIDGIYQTGTAKQYTFTDMVDNPTIYEGVINRQIAALLISKLIAAKFDVADVVAQQYPIKTPTSWKELEQADIALSKRTTFANKIAKQYKGKDKSVYLSLHSNAAASSNKGDSIVARGTYFYTSEAGTTADIIAAYIRDAYKESIIKSYIPLRKNALQEKDFWVLRKTNMPAILGEVGFFTNWEDGLALRDGDLIDLIPDINCQDEIANMYYEGLKKYRNSL